MISLRDERKQKEKSFEYPARIKIMPLTVAGATSTGELRVRVLRKFVRKLQN